jgi:hypothetical protein
VDAKRGEREERLLRVQLARVMLTTHDFGVAGCAGKRWLGTGLFFFPVLDTLGCGVWKWRMQRQLLVLDVNNYANSCRTEMHTACRAPAPPFNRAPNGC